MDFITDVEFAAGTGVVPWDKASEDAETGGLAPLDGKSSLCTVTDAVEISDGGDTTGACGLKTGRKNRER
jgi:hypothetical protein